MVKAAGILAAIAVSLGAQQPRVTDPALLLRADAQQRVAWATEWLHSDDPRNVAWGAWLARQDHQTALIPQLIEKVEAYQPGGEGDGHDAMLAVLDALIELRAPVTVAEARKLFPEFAAQSLILLVRSPDDAQAELLDIFRDAQADSNWLAAGNVLAKTWPPGFAALLLARLTQHLTVSVFDPNHGGNSGGGVYRGCGFSLRQPKAGWPPVGLYLLSQFPERLPWLTSTFLVGGGTPVYYYRSEPGNYDNPFDDSSNCSGGDRDRYRAQYLEKRVSLNPCPDEIIEWKDESQYRKDLIAAVEERKVAFRRAVASLSERVLTPDEAEGMKPRLEIVIRDCRENPAAPLPTVLEEDASVAVRTAFTKPLR